MENQKKNKIIASALVCLIAFFAICLLLGVKVHEHTVHFKFAKQFLFHCLSHL